MFNFKKIATVLTSAVMLSSTIGFAAAASYPAPFVDGGTADGAVVYGANAAITDVTAAIDVQQKLSALVTSSTGSGSDAAVVGEAAPLFSGGTKLYVNDTLNAVKSSLTKVNLPTVLKDESFSGNVDATMTQTIVLGTNPRITFEKQPTSSDEPQYALKTSTSTANYIYNSTVTFSKAVNFTHSDSEGEDIDLFGNTFTVSSSTDTTNLILLQSAEKLSLDSDSPSADVTISGSVYTIELVSASDTSATIKVTDSSGNAESKEIDEAASKKINGITVAVTTADETNLKLSASVVAGSEKITMSSGSTITTGEDDDSLDGATAYFTGGTGAMTKLVISIVAGESDEDAIKSGESMTDPVFKTFKLDFAGMNIAEDSDAREDIFIGNNGDDKMEVKFTDHTGNEKTIMFAKNTSTHFQLLADDDNRNFSVLEAEIIRYQDVVVVGNEEEGHVLKLTSVDNESSTDFGKDKVWFTDQFTGDVLKTTFTAHGVGTLNVGGKDYSITLTGDASSATEDFTVRVNNDGDSSGNAAIVFPTVDTSKGARLGFYAPQNVQLDSWDGTNVITEIKIPDGDGYTSISSIAIDTIPATNATWNFTAGGTVNQLNTLATAETASFTATIGQLTFNFSSTGTANQTKIRLHDVSGAPMDQPGLFIFEEKDDNNVYEALVVNLENGVDSDDGIGLTNIGRTWLTSLTTGSSNFWQSMPGDSKTEKAADLWGTIITYDKSDSDQTTATISYPDEQIYAQLYIAEESAAITPGMTGSSGGGGSVMIIKDSEISSATSKNLFVVGGSCINTVAAKILGSDSPLCTTDFTTATGVGAGQYIIKSAVSPYNDNKVATLVAGYNAGDTTNAVNKALEGVTTDSGTEQVYPISTA